ncbi:MAG: CatA-like O-acetyltransferase, partial [Flavonifractor plautii]
MTIIDKETWPRRAHYDFFTPMSDPFYTLTFPVDVTPLRAWCRGRSLPFYPAMVFAVTKAMEAVDAFHYKDRDGVIVRHDTLVPSFTRPEAGQRAVPDCHCGGGGGPGGLLPPGQGPGGGPDRVHHLRPLGRGSARLLHLPALVPPHSPE